MMEFKTGDIFTQDAEALVNSVNCVGVMGRRDCPSVQEFVPGQLQGLLGRLQTRRSSTRPNVRLRKPAK